MPPGQQVKVHKSASFLDILEVCKFTIFCDRERDIIIHHRKILNGLEHNNITITKWGRAI